MTTAHHVPSWIALTGAHNVRDLGGLPAAEGAVRPGVLLRGDSLDTVTADDIALLRDEVGLRGVVDLRAPFEKPKAAAWFPELGITWMHEPLLDLTGLTDPRAAQARIGNDYATFYEFMLEGAGPGLARILDFLVSDARTPALVHCAAGKDRTGIVTSVLLALADVERDAIVADYVATEQRIQAVRDALVSREAYRHLRERAEAEQQGTARGQLGSLALDPNAIIRVLDIIESAPGGVAGYLATYGVTPDQITRWREILIEQS